MHTPRTSPSRYLESPHPQAVERLVGVTALASSSAGTGTADAADGAAAVVATSALAPVVAASTAGGDSSSLPWIVAALALAGAAVAIGALRRRRTT